MNINNCQILIEQMYKSCEMKKEEQIQNLIYLGKKCHNMTKPKNPDTIPELKRNIGNMCYCINKFFNAKKKFYKLIILESDPEKMSDSTEPYSILCSIFNEDYITKKETREDTDKKGEKLIEYLETFLNTCDINIDTYIEDVTKELCHARKKLIRFETIGYDIIKIIEWQDEWEKKYNKKLGW